MMDLSQADDSHKVLFEPVKTGPVTAPERIYVRSR